VCEGSGSDPDVDEAQKAIAGGAETVVLREYPPSCFWVSALRQAGL
jgi:hypothetical protein